jgi:hypothetical protein
MTQTQEIQAASRRNLWQALISLLVAAAAGLILHYLWEHLGLPEKPGPNWGWPKELPAGLIWFSTLGLPVMVWLPTAVLCLSAHLFSGISSPSVGKVCLRALTMDAATYLLLPAVLLLPVLWRELGNGFAAMGLTYFSLYSFKALLIIWVTWNLMTEHQSGLRLQAVLFGAGFTVFFLPLLWAWQATVFEPQEQSLITGALSILPGFGQSGEVAAQQGSLIFRMVLAPFALAGGRMGGLFLNALCAAGAVCLIRDWLYRTKLRFPSLAVGMIMLSSPIWACLGRVGPEPLGLLVTALAVWGCNRPAFAAICAMHLSILDPAYLPVGLALLLWSFRQTLRTGWSSVLWRNRILLIFAALGMAASVFWGQSQLDAKALYSLGPRGLLLLSPIWLLVLAGVPAGFGKNRETAAWLLALPLAILIHTTLADSLGLDRAPDRAAAIALPLAAWFLSRSLAGLSGPWMRLAVALPGCLTLCYTWLSALLPHLRQAPGSTPDPLLEGMGRALALNLAGVLPLGANHTASLVWAGFWLLAVVWLGWQVWRTDPLKEAESTQPFTTLEGYGLALGMGCALLAAILAASII